MIKRYRKRIAEDQIKTQNYSPVVNGVKVKDEDGKVLWLNQTPRTNWELELKKMS